MFKALDHPILRPKFGPLPNAKSKFFPNSRQKNLILTESCFGSLSLKTVSNFQILVKIPQISQFHGPRPQSQKGV